VRRASFGALAAAAAVACGGPRQAAPPAAPAEQGPRLSEAEILAVKDPHAAQPRPFCWSCHVAEGRRELRQDPIALCQRCHGSAAHGSHPVDVVQRTSAGGLPLWKGGRVVCHTCHDPHDVKRNANGLRLAFDPLCLECHRPVTARDHGAHAGGHGRNPPAGKKPPDHPR
jgi:predicted CXXCH cytochrome family protein